MVFLGNVFVLSGFSKSFNRKVNITTYSFEKTFSIILLAFIEFYFCKFSFLEESLFFCLSVYLIFWSYWVVLFIFFGEKFFIIHWSYLMNNLDYLWSLRIIFFGFKDNRTSRAQKFIVNCWHFSAIYFSYVNSMICFYRKCMSALRYEIKILIRNDLDYSFTIGNFNIIGM